MRMPAEIHPAARSGFGSSADAYERGRPDYPAAAIAWMAEVLDLRPGRVVLDVGAGTGKLTRLLVPTGARVVGVEPVAAMLSEFAAAVPGVAVVGGRAEALPFRDRSVAAAVVAQAFHWFDGPVALAELHRVLRPGGGLALAWNVRDDRVAWVRALTELIEPHRAGTPSRRPTEWMPAFDGSRHFGPLERRSFRNEQPLTRDGVIDRFLSISFIAVLPQPRREEIRAGVLRILDGDPATAGRDSVVLPYRTDVYVTRAA